MMTQRGTGGSWMATRQPKRERSARGSRWARVGRGPSRPGTGSIRRTVSAPGEGPANAAGGPAAGPARAAARRPRGEDGLGDARQELQERPRHAVAPGLVQVAAVVRVARDERRDPVAVELPRAVGARGLDERQ